MHRLVRAHARIEEDEDLVLTRLLGRIALALSASVMIFGMLYFFVLYILSE